jgi:hypothetical protein
MKAIEKIIYVDPAKIKKIAFSEYYNIHDTDCKIMGGNWDIENIVHIEESFIYDSLYSMFVKSIKWEDTSLYGFIKKGIENKDYKWNCDTEEKIKKRGEYLHNLFDSIKNNGILTHTDAIKNNLINSYGFIENDDIAIGIGRNGELLFLSNGSHRLSICKILGIKKVPVRVYRRHTEWESIRDYIFDKCNNLWGGKSYQQLPHPDFDEIENMWSDYRYDLFRDNTASDTGSTLLDIGSLFGYICYRAELDGYKATACEIDKNYLDVMLKLHNSYEMEYNIIDSDFLALKSVKYDIIIAFNILHHFLKSEYLFNRLISFLNECDFNEMFLQVHEKNEPQMEGAYMNFSPEEFVEFVKGKTSKKNHEFLGEEMGRKIYKIY